MARTEEGQRTATISNDEQLWLMQQVKQNLMTIDEAVSWTENRESELRTMGDDIIATNEKHHTPQRKHAFSATKKFKSFLSRKSQKPIVEVHSKRKSSGTDEVDALTPTDLRNKQIYNFSIYKCGKQKNPQKRIFQIDFDLKSFSLIHHGNVVKTSLFSSLINVNGQEGKKLFIYLDDSQELEINAENLADKTKLIRLLNIVSEQNEHEENGQSFDPCDKLQQSFRVIKEGYLEKKGGYSASQWHKRFVVIRSGELAYYRVEEEELSAALNIIHLSPGSVAINAEDNNTFTLATTKESHRFHVPEGSGNPNPEVVRDQWIQAIHEACSRHYQETENSDGNPSPFRAPANDVTSDNNFYALFQEIEKLRSGLISGGSDETLVNQQIGKFLSMLKDFESGQRSSVDSLSDTATSASLLSSNSLSTSTSQSGASKSNTFPRVNNDAHVRKPNVTSSSASLSSDAEVVYSMPFGAETQTVANESVYLLEQDRTAFTSSIYTIAEGCGSSDEEKITTFSCFLPPPPAEETSNATSPELDLFPLPPPPVNLCNGSATLLEQHPLTNGTNEVIPNGFVNGLEVMSIPEKDPVSHAHENTASPVDKDTVLPDLNKPEESAYAVIDFSSKEDRKEENTSESQKPPMIKPQSTNSSAPSSPSEVLTSPPPPPPPPLPGIPNAPPIPPPPPVGSSPSNDTLKKATKKDKIAMRPFHWVPVPKQMINKSMWKNSPDVSSSINAEELKEMFKSTDKKQDSESTPKKEFTPDSTKKTQLQSYLDRKTAQNLGIFMAGFKLRGEELVRKLSVVSEIKGGISTEHLIALLKFAPEPEMKSLYKTHAGRETEELAKEDRFIAELSRVPRLGLRLETLRIVRELPLEVDSLQPEINNVLNAFLELLSSKRFETILHYTLSITNLINSSNSKGTVKGIRLSTLTKLNSMRSNSRKETLLQLIVNTLKQSQPDALALQEELTAFSKSQSYSIKGLLAEIDIMRKSSFKARKNCEMLRRKKNQPTKEDLMFCGDIEVELSKNDTIIQKMSEKCLEIRQTVSKVLVKFGEAPDTDSQELCQWIRSFLEDLRKVNR